jgi:hypothetical protein
METPGATRWLTSAPRELRGRGEWPVNNYAAQFSLALLCEPPLSFPRISGAG